MLLSENQFDQLAEHLGAGAAETVGGQRREPRLRLRTRLTLVPCPNGLDGPIGPPLSVPARDLSRGGIRFMLPRRLSLDTQFLLLLPTCAAPAPAHPHPHPHPYPDAQTDWLPVLCAVTYWQPLAKDIFAVGGQFVRVPAATELPLADLMIAAPRIVLPHLIPTEADPSQELLPRLAG